MVYVMKERNEMSNPYLLLSKAFSYPAPGRLVELKEGLMALPEGSEGVKSAFTAFLERIGQLTQGEWEELCTRTLDLTPLAAPYVGFQVWGDTYQRGEFLTTMKQEMAKYGICLEGELPDHLVLVLNYLGRASEPLPELVEVAVPAIERMLVTLHNADPDNPYLELLKAAQLACKDLKKEAT